MFKKREEQLITASKKGNIDKIREILETNEEDINCTDV